MQLHGTAVDVNVRLDKGSILMENTYIGLCSQRLERKGNDRERRERKIKGTGCLADLS